MLYLSQSYPTLMQASNNRAAHQATLKLGLVVNVLSSRQLAAHSNKLVGMIPDNMIKVVKNPNTISCVPETAGDILIVL